MVALNVELLNKTFLVGERITLADISVACHLIAGYTKLFDADYRKPFPNVTRWFLTVVNQPKVKAIVGEIALCTATLKYDAKKAAAASAPKAEKPKKEAAAPQEESLEDIAAAEAKAEAKKKNPLDELPPSSLVLDNWKRFYSNNSEADSCKWFWENYDPQGYSLWKVEVWPMLPRSCASTLYARMTAYYLSLDDTHSTSTRRSLAPSSCRPT